MPLKYLLRVFSISLGLAVFNVAAENIQWKLVDSPILIDADIDVLAGEALSIDAGTEIRFANDVDVIIQGKIEVLGQGEVKLTSVTNQTWHGLSIESDETFTISNLNISNAITGIHLTSSPNVVISGNVLENNTTGIRLTANDGVRSYVNTISNNQIRNNHTGIFANNTGADIKGNLIASNSSYGIDLSGRSCGGGSVCGYRSIIQNNLISGGEVGVSVYAQHLTMNNNDIYNSAVGFYNRSLIGASYSVTDNNILGWSAFAVVNGAANSVNAGNISFGQPASEQSICDVNDNVILGNVAFVAAQAVLPSTHNYDLPTANETETRAAHPLCPEPERIINDFTSVSLIAGINNDNTSFLDFNIAVSAKFSDARFIQVLYWPLNAEQTWLTITRDRDDDVFSKTVLLPTFVKSGVYEIRAIIAVDNSGREIRIDDYYLKQGGYDYRTLIENDNSDNEAPALQAMTNSAPYADGSEQLHIDFSISASDNLAGLNSSFVIELISPTGKSIQKRGTFAEEGLIQTSAELDFVLPKFSASGAYHVNTVRLYDLAGNLNYSQQWIADNFNPIAIENPNSDNLSPNLNNVTLSAAFDLLSKRPIITISVATSDDIAGVKSSYVRLRKPAGGLLESGMIKQTETSGEVATTAQFITTFALTTDYVTGDYIVNDVCIADEANNERCYFTSELSSLLFNYLLNVNFVDTDSDGIPDEYDAFPLIPIGNLLDTDGDGAPNDCDSACQTSGMSADDDDDNDGVLDVDDAFPLDASESQDTDLDGVGNNIDTDDDGDGIPDTYELANGLNPLDANDAGLDKDNDGLSNLDEFRFGTNINLADTDEDGLNDNVDNNPLVFDEVVPTLYSGQLQILPDMTDDGIAEVGIFWVDSSLEQIVLEVLNGQDLSVIKTIIWADNYVDTTVALHLIPDMNNNGADEVGVFGVQDKANNEGKPQMFVRDLQTGNRVSVYNWPANWKSVSALVMDDISGDGIAEIAIQGRFKEGSRPQLVVRNGDNGSSQGTFSYPNLFTSPIFYQHSDVDGDGFAEISTFGRITRNNKIQVKITNGVDSGDRMKAYNFPDKWANISWHRLDDSNDDGEYDWGMFGINKADGRPQLIVKNGTDPRGALRIHAWPAVMQDAQFYQIPDINNDGVDEVAAAGRRSNNGRYQFQIQDGLDRNVVLTNYNLNLSLTSVTYHVLPDLSGDELVEIGFMGINPEGEYELIIQHGNTLNGEYARYNLGSDWQSAPSITSLGDTDNDGLTNLLIYGQDNSGNLLRMENY